MVSYDEAVAIIQDPDADPTMLAKIAYENPEFGANVAAHARSYPGLKRWLAEFGDGRARRLLAQMGYEAPLGPVVDRAADAGDAPASRVDADRAAFDDGAGDPDRHVDERRRSFARPQAVHGFTARKAATTNDPAVMQRIAQVAPELRAALASNPCLYPELLVWLGALGDPAVDEALSKRG